MALATLRAIGNQCYRNTQPNCRRDDEVEIQRRISTGYVAVLSNMSASRNGKRVEVFKRHPRSISRTQQGDFAGTFGPNSANRANLLLLSRCRHQVLAGFEKLEKELGKVRTVLMEKNMKGKKN